MGVLLISQPDSLDTHLLLPYTVATPGKRGETSHSGKEMEEKELDPDEPSAKFQEDSFACDRVWTSIATTVYSLVLQQLPLRSPPRFVEGSLAGGRGSESLPYVMNASFLKEQEVQANVSRILARHTQLPFFGELQRCVKYYREFCMARAKAKRQEESEMRH